MATFQEWAALARTLSERQFVARHSGFFLLSTEQAEPKTQDGLEIWQTEVSLSLKGKSQAARRSFEIRPVAKANAGDDPISVGRARACDLSFRHPSVSKLHAHLFTKGGRLVVVDAKSRNGTLINGQLILVGEPTQLALQDCVQFGDVQTMVLDARELHKLLATMTAE